LKRLIKSTIFFAILGVIIYLSANYILKKAAVRVVQELKPRLEQKGIIIREFSYANVRLSSYNSVVINRVDLEFYLKKTMYGKESFDARFDAGSVSVRFADFNNPSFFFTLTDFNLYVESDETNTSKPFGKLENGHIKSRIPLYLKYPEESAREILTEIRILFKDNQTRLDLDVSTEVLLGIDQKEVKVGLYTERIDTTTYLRFDDQDILKAAESFDLDLTEKEAEIIAQYPSKVPAMIKITRDAKRLSKTEKAKNSRFPEDAYRHIYWSYHLTKALGPKLAKQITDAHETAPGNTKSERLMDYHNNEVGRSYAIETLSIDELKRRVLQSGEIIRSPEDIG